MIMDVLAQRILAEFEPPMAPIQFDSAQVGAITRAIRRATQDEFVPFARRKARWDFLEAARRYLSSLANREELLVAFGTKGGASRRSRSHLIGFVRSLGTERRVALGARLVARLSEVASSANQEALIVHNHPPYWVRRIAATLGLWKATPSEQDRDLMIAYELARGGALLSNGSAGRFRWYLVDEGEIAEFRLPSLRVMGDLLQRYAGNGTASHSAAGGQ